VRRLQLQKLAIRASFANAGFLNHEGHEDHKDFSFLRVFCDLRGLSFYGVANRGSVIDEQPTIRTIHLKSVSSPVLIIFKKEK
jgi:hypothetical protein